MYFLREEECAEVTGVAIELLTDLFKTLGPASFDKNLDDLSTVIVKLLENVDDEEEENEGENEDEEAESYILDSITDLIPALCKLCGDSFGLHF